jgi:hypothetical protein
MGYPSAMATMERKSTRHVPAPRPNMNQSRNFQCGIYLSLIPCQVMKQIAAIPAMATSAEASASMGFS